MDELAKWVKGQFAPKPVTAIRAKVVRDNAGYRIVCQRAKYKHWFELGLHRETDAAFESAYRAGTLNWNPDIDDATKLF